MNDTGSVGAKGSRQLLKQCGGSAAASLPCCLSWLMLSLHFSHFFASRLCHYISAALPPFHTYPSHCQCSTIPSSTAPLSPSCLYPSICPSPPTHTPYPFHTWDTHFTAACTNGFSCCGASAVVISTTRYSLCTTPTLFTPVLG